MPKEITIPVGWLKRLDELTEKYINSPSDQKDLSFNLLLGYLQSVKFLLK